MNLDSKIEEVIRVMKGQDKALKRLRIETVRDLLYHFPVRYGDTATIKNISEIENKEDVTLYGKISKLKTGKTFRSNISRATATLTDDSGSINITWFSQPYIAKMLKENSLVQVIGKVAMNKESLVINNPKVENVTKVPIGVGESLFGESKDEHTLYPVYKTSKGITSNWIYHAIQKIFRSEFLETLTDPIPEDILDKYNLPSLNTALIWIHSPKKEEDALVARKRFSFEEIFFIQLKKNLERSDRDSHKSFKINPLKEKVDDFISRFPFKPTGSQTKSIKSILKDFKSGKPMSRLLEGDVGSGKTAVAAATIYAATVTAPDNQDFGHLQTAYMVPTEILAKQHFANFITFFEHMGVNIGLITGSGCYKFPSKVNQKESTKISRAQLLKWVENGEIPILIGTHSLIQKSVKFKNLAYVIIDEQHRFGTAQRGKLARKDEFAPHLLSMTATPIPRTLALTIFGDLDLTLLDQMPTGRKPIITELVLPNKREETYKMIEEKIKEGRQMYVICPRINEPDPDKLQALNVKSVKEEAKRLKRDIFRDREIDILHSKMKPQEKEDAMKRFEDGETDILVATSVVEVGVNVPNATMIIIEGAERFGLSQLHQLRGRVIRSNHQAYCFVFSDSKTSTTVERLKAMKESKNGFELSEFDLKLRGAGELYGTKQWGITDIGMEAIKNIKMVEAARNEAQEIVKNIKKYPILIKELDNRKEVHFE
ncbi:MAG: ATP-dependent DNA helicase RecG [Candidatus Paceibacteria bacterium]|jgi:ATP-dependent DNA helicase RecG